MDGKPLLEKLSTGTNIEKTLQEIGAFLDSCEELYSPHNGCTRNPVEKGARQLRLLAERGRAFTTVTKNKLELILKFILQFDATCRKDWKQQLHLPNEEYDRIGRSFFSTWKRCLDILFSNKSILKLNNESDLERYSYNFIANALNKGSWVDAMSECFRYMFYLFKRLDNLKNVTYQPLQESTIHSICKTVETNWRKYHDTLHNDFFLMLFSLLRALRMSLEKQQFVLFLNKCDFQVLPLLHMVINIWRDICSTNDGHYLKIAPLLNACQQEVFLVLCQILCLYEDNDTKWSQEPILESSIELYWRVLDCQLSASNKVLDVRENKSWSSDWLRLVEDIAFKLHRESYIRAILRRIRTKNNFSKLDQQSSTCHLLMDTSRWFSQQGLKRSVEDWLGVSETLIEVFDTFEAFSIFREIEQKRYSCMVLLQQSKFQDFLKCYEEDTLMKADYAMCHLVFYRWMFSYVHVHFQSPVFVRDALNSFLRILKRFQAMKDDKMETELWNVFNIIKSAIMDKLQGAIADETKLFELLFPALEGIQVFLNDASYPSYDDLIMNLAKLFHNIAATLVQKNSGLLVASICMRRSIDLRGRISNQKEDQISRLGLLCKIMLRLSEPCAFVSVFLEMISTATFSHFHSNTPIPNDIFKALESFASWCERNETCLKEYFGTFVLEQLAIHSGPNAVELAFVVFRLLRWQSRNGFIKPHQTWSCERNCVLVLQQYYTTSITQDWLLLELLRLTFYQELNVNDENISMAKDKDRHKIAEVEYLQMIHLGWKLIVAFMRNSNHSVSYFSSSGILESWDKILKHSPHNIRHGILIHLFEIFEWFSQVFMITQNSQLLWLIARMICQFIIVCGQSYLVDMIHMREYLTFVSATALKNYRLYDNAKTILSHMTRNSSGEHCLELLQFALDVSSYDMHNSFEIPDLKDLSCSISSRAMHKFYLSQFLWKKGDLKESYDNALDSVKLHLAKLQQASWECTRSLESKSFHLAGTQINVNPSSTGVGMLDDLRQAAECLCWLGELCEKIGFVSEAEYYWQCCLDVFQWIHCFPWLLQTTFHLMMLYRKSLQTDKLKRSIESFQSLIDEIQQNHRDSILQLVSSFCLKRLNLMTESLCGSGSLPTTTTSCCTKHLEDCKECCKDYFLWSWSNSEKRNNAFCKNRKFLATITQYFIHPHDQAMFFYEHSKKIVSALVQSNEKLLWKFTQQPNQAQVEQSMPHVIHLIKQALQLVMNDPLPWLQKRLLLLLADIKGKDSSQRDTCLYYVQKACGLEYWYQYQVYRYSQEESSQLSELREAMQNKLQITRSNSTCCSIPLLNSFPKEWTIAGLTPSCDEMYLWLRPGSHQIMESPILIKYSLKSLEEDGKNTLEYMKYKLERLLQESHDQASGRQADNNLSMEEKSLWWKERKQLDEQFSEYMRELEERLFGAWKILLLSTNTIVDEDTELAFDELQAISGKQWLLDRQLFQIIFSRRIFLDRKEDWLYLLTCAIDYHHRSISQQPKLLKKLEEYVNEWWWMTTEAGKSRTKHGKQLKANSSILLVLDDTLLPFPIESIPFLNKWEQGVSRISNLELATCLFLQQKNSFHYNHSDSCYSVSTKKAFFILNPSGDLSRTQQTFESLFQQTYGWEGIVGPFHNSSKSQVKELVEKLSRYQLFVYCGHGTGEKFFPAKEIKKLEQAPVTLLMGCSSGKPFIQGIYSPTVQSFAFLYANAQAVVVNLWDVTDRDIDRFTNCLLEEWFSSHTIDLALAIVRARKKCYFTHLTGCAPVVYGLPWIRTLK